LELEIARIREREMARETLLKTLETRQRKLEVENDSAF
jgi:hypothetical protein